MKIISKIMYFNYDSNFVAKKKTSNFFCICYITIDGTTAFTEKFS